MKKTLFLVVSMVALCVWAQPSHGTKSDYRWKMNSFRTSDNYQLCSFSYDASHHLLAIRDSVRGEYTVVDSMTYDANGNMVRLSGWQRLDGEMQNVYYIDYTYNEAGLITSRTNYNNFGGSWELGGVYNYTYNAQNQLVLTTLTMGNMVYQKTEYQYDGDNCVLELWYSYNFDVNGLLPSEKYVTTYADGRKVLMLDSISSDGTYWMYNGKYTYAYDNRGNCTEYHHYDNYNREIERSVYTYDNSKPLASTLIPHNPEMERPRTYNNVDACVREAWYTVDVDQVLQYVCDYIYDYSDINAALHSPVAERVALYPNPASAHVTLVGLPEGVSQVQIYDLSGKLVSTQHAGSSHMTMDVSGFVPGCYVVRLTQGASVQNVKLVVR